MAEATARTDLAVRSRLWMVRARPGAVGNSAVAHYWIVDPAGPAVTARELRAGHYAEAGHAAGDERLRIERPFVVEITPSALVSGGPAAD